MIGMKNVIQIKNLQDVIDYAKKNLYSIVLWGSIGLVSVVGVAGVCLERRAIDRVHEEAHKTIRQYSHLWNKALQFADKNKDGELGYYERAQFLSFMGHRGSASEIVIPFITENNKPIQKRIGTGVSAVKLYIPKSRLEEYVNSNKQ